MKTLILAAATLLAADTEPLFYLEPAFDTIESYGAYFDPDGKRLHVSGTVWDLESGRQTGVAPSFKSDDGPAVAWSPDKKLVVTYSQDLSKMKLVSKDPLYVKGRCEVRLNLWDVAQNKRLAHLGKWRYPAYSTGSGFQPYWCGAAPYAFSADGKRILVNMPVGGWEKFDVSGRPDAMIYDGWTAYVFTLDGKSKQLPGYSYFLPDGRLMSLVFDDRKLQQLVDGDTGAVISYPRNASHHPVELQLSGDGSKLLMRYSWEQNGNRTFDQQVQVWDVPTGELLVDRRFEKWTLHLALSGGWLVASQGEKRWGFDLQAKGAERPLPKLENDGQLFASGDGRFLAFRHPQRRVISVYRVISDAAPAAPKQVAALATNVDTPPTAKLPVDPNAYAVVVGIEKYQEAGIPKVDYAARDAATVHRYLTESLGFDAANVVLLQDERATKAGLQKNLAWLKNRVTDKSRIFLYFAGHGAPNPATGQGFLVLHDGDPNYTEETAYPIQDLYDALAKLPAKDVTVVLDACFSGAGGRSLLAKGARPLVTQAKATAGGNTSVISAASGAQISAGYPQGRHGLLTYFLLEGLHGGADADKDGAVTTLELYTYARPAVEREARKQNLEQTPTMTGAGATIWLKK